MKRVLVVFLAACHSTPPPQPITIGFLAPLTGDIAAFGRDLTDASNLALEEINSGGGVIGGRELRLTVYDTGTSATGAQLGYTELLNEEVPAILGPTASSESVAVRDQVVAGTTVTVSQSATSPELGTLDWGGYFFRMAPSDAVQSVVLAELITATLAPSAQLCVVFRDDPYGNGLMQALQGRITNSITQAKFDPAQADLSHVLDPCDPLIAGAGNGILFITLVADGAQLIDDAASRGWNPPTTHHVFLTDGTKNHDLVTILAHPGFVEGAQGTAATGPDPNTPAGAVRAAFDTRFVARFSINPDVYTEMAYDAVYVVAIGLELAATTSDRPAIRDALGKIGAGSAVPPGDWKMLRDVLGRDKQVQYTGASGNVAFDAIGGVMPPHYISVWTVTGGTVVEVRIEEIDTN
jgi:branched-chain amino acid transport system substrate-binding protein